MVAETLSWSGSRQVSINLATMVDFPEPLGPEMMISLPLCACSSSFDILDQLPDRFDGSFDRYHLMGDGSIVGLGSDGIGFASYFLGQEIESASLGILLIDRRQKLLQVAIEPDDFLPNIASI